MKTNHRDGTKDRKGYRCVVPYNADLKYENRRNRRVRERRACRDIVAGRIDAGEAVLPGRKNETSDHWNHD